ncbi:MAG: TrmH family RNA methyltransferase [Gammaproteobacteria bacterium]
MSNTGKQLDSQQLYEHQKQKIAQGLIKTAPAILIAGLTKSENIGAVYRLADAAGCNTIYLLEENDKSLDTKIIKKVSRNTLESIQTTRLNLEQLKIWYRKWPPMIAIEITSKSTSILHTQLPRNCVLVIGNEKYGVAEDVLNMCNQAVHVPMYGLNGSMNASHALAIVLYEWRRQYL